MERAWKEQKILNLTPTYPTNLMLGELFGEAGRSEVAG